MAEAREKEQFAARMSASARDPKALLALGKAAFLSECYADAVAAYQRCIALDAGDDSAHYNLGVALQAMGKTREARKAFMRALEINPKRKAAQEALNSLAAY